MTTDEAATEPSRRPRIVVGTDGSPGAETALRWAVDHAARLGADLDVVVAWDFEAKWATGANPEWPSDAAHLASDATTLAEQSVARALGDRPRPASLTIHALQGTPALTLIEHARGADLLVVGSRGRGGFSKLLLGSVSTACVKHATCPTVVIPADTLGPD